jgi:glycosyltransferase involved in cell wall biosynthesis
VATYARWKGQDLFLHAAAALLRQGITDVAFYIIGGPVYKTRDSQFTVAELRQQIVHLGLAAHCALIPFQQDLPPIYRALDIVVHASTRPEPFGRTIIEAMACGRAVVVSAAGGAVELFTEGVDALGVPPGRLPPLIEALRQLIHDPALRQRLGTAARQTAVRRFDLQVMAQRLLPLYHELLDVDQPGQKVH